MNFSYTRIIFLTGMLWGSTLSLYAEEGPAPEFFATRQAPFVIQNRSPTRPALGAQTTLVVVATSDLHGWLSTETLFPEDRKKGMLHIASLIEQLRATYPDLILLDAGDTLQGSPTNFYFNYHAPSSDEPLPIVKLMNRLQYDAVALGNHDLEPPPRVLQKNLKRTDFPWLAANLLKAAGNPDEGAPALPPYHVLERAGVRIGVLGLLTPGTSMWVNKTHLAGLEIEDMFVSTQKWVPILKQQEQVDLLIGLFHSGHSHRYDQYVALNQGVPISNAAGIIADYEDRFDLIISGHAHRLFPKRRTSELRHFRTPLISPGFWGYGASVIKFLLKEKKGRWQIAKTEFRFTSAAREPSAEFRSLVQTEMDQVQQYLESPTAVWLHDQPTKENFYQCSAVLSHRATLSQDQKKALSLLPGRWRWKKVPQKELHHPLKRLHLFRWLPYDNFLVQAQLYGRQIQILLENYRRQQQGRFFRHSSLLMPGGFQAKFVGNEGAARLRLEQMKKPMPLSELYSVWLTNYHWNGGGGLVAEALIHPSQKLKETKQTLRDLVFAYLQTPASLPDSCLTFLTKDHVSAKQP